MSGRPTQVCLDATSCYSPTRTRRHPRHPSGWPRLFTSRKVQCRIELSATLGPPDMFGGRGLGSPTFGRWRIPPLSHSAGRSVLGLSPQTLRLVQQFFQSSILETKPLQHGVAPSDAILAAASRVTLATR